MPELVFVAIDDDGSRSRLTVQAGRWIYRILSRWRPRADVRLVVSSPLAHMRLQLDGQPGVVWPIDLVNQPELEAVYGWGTSVAAGLVGEMPPSDIPRRRQLGRALLDGSLQRYGNSLVALLGAVNTFRPSRVLIITSSWAFGRALFAELRLVAPQISAFHVAPPHLPRVIRKWRRPRTVPAATPLKVSRADVLFMAFSEPMLAMMLPIAVSVEASQLRPLVVACCDVADRAITGVDIPVAFLPARPEYRSLTSFLREGGNGTADAADVESFVTPGARVPNPLRRLVSLLDGCKALDGLLADVDALLSAVMPRAVVLGNDRHWTGQTVVAMARRRRIRSVLLQDGVAGNTPNWRWMTADVAGVLGEAHAAQLASCGYAGRVSVVGRPDPNSKDLSDARAECRARLRLSPTALVLLLALQDGQHPDYVDALVHACLATARAHVLIRAHPSDVPQKRFATELALSSPRITDATAPALADVLAATDVVVTQYSTVAVEACLAGRRAIAADFSGSAPILDLAAIGVASRASTPAALSELVARLAVDTPPGDPCSPTSTMVNAARRLIIYPTTPDPVAAAAALITSAAGL